MTEDTIKRKPGRPQVVQQLSEPMTQIKEDAEIKKVGHFIVINTPTIKGVRLNLEKIRTYCKAGSSPNNIQMAWDNGTASNYEFGSSEAAEEFLEFLDKHCL